MGSWGKGCTLNCDEGARGEAVAGAAAERERRAAAIAPSSGGNKLGRDEDGIREGPVLWLAARAKSYETVCREIYQ